jgi:hypothetical protein
MSTTLTHGTAFLWDPPNRTSLTLTDERKRLFEQASEFVAVGPANDPPRSDVIDGHALTELTPGKTWRPSATATYLRK